MSNNGLLASTDVCASADPTSNLYVRVGSAENGVLSVTAGTNVAVTGTLANPIVGVVANPVVSTLQASNAVFAPTNPAGALFQSGVAFTCFTPDEDGLYLCQVSMETGPSQQVIVQSCIASVAKKSPAGPLIIQITPLAVNAGVVWSVVGTTGPPLPGYNGSVAVTQTNGTGDSYPGTITFFRCAKNTLF